METTYTTITTAQGVQVSIKDTHFHSAASNGIPSAPALPQFRALRSRSFNYRVRNWRAYPPGRMAQSASGAWWEPARFTTSPVVIVDSQAPSAPALPHFRARSAPRFTLRTRDWLYNQQFNSELFLAKINMLEQVQLLLIRDSYLASLQSASSIPQPPPLPNFNQFRQSRSQLMHPHRAHPVLALRTRDWKQWHGSEQQCLALDQRREAIWRESFELNRPVASSSSSSSQLEVQPVLLEQSAVLVAPTQLESTTYVQTPLSSTVTTVVSEPAPVATQAPLAAVVEAPVVFQAPVQQPVLAQQPVYAQQPVSMQQAPVTYTTVSPMTSTTVLNTTQGPVQTTEPWKTIVAPNPNSIFFGEEANKTSFSQKLKSAFRKSKPISEPSVNTQANATQTMTQTVLPTPATYAPAATTVNYVTPAAPTTTTYIGQPAVATAPVTFSTPVALATPVASTSATTVSSTSTAYPLATTTVLPTTVQTRSYIETASPYTQTSTSGKQSSMSKLKGIFKKDKSSSGSATR